MTAETLPDRRWPRDLLLALIIVTILGTVWAAQGWAGLSALALGDTDDGMRLQQVRDWLGGQAWSDLTQTRLGPPGGLVMHWSRLADLPLAAIIALLTPLTGAHTAQLAAILIWPPILFAMQLMLIGAIARRLGGDHAASTAMLVAALAFPSIAQFMPGRIDHHGLQIVLLTACIHGLLRAPSKAGGAAIGAAVFASIATGLEMLPLIAVIGGWAVILWLRGESGARLAGIGAGLAITGILGAGLIPAGAPTELCDAFNTPLRTVLIAGGIGALLIATFADRQPVPRWALAAALGIGLAVLGATTVPACLSGPYGAVDPLLERLWLRNVVEAQPLYKEPLGMAIGDGGLMIAGLIATLWQARRAGGAWWGLAALIGTALLVSCLQVRGSAAGAALAAPALAMLIGVARTKGVGALAGAWIVSAGILYPIAGALIDKPMPEAPAGIACTAPKTFAALNRLPPGRIAAPIDFGAFAIPTTRHSSLAGPYHRNNSGNAAMYRIFLGPDTDARATAAQMDIRYIAWCKDAFGEVNFEKEAAPDALARRLRANRPPAWLRRLGSPGAGLTVYAVAGPARRAR